jgi:hypothetical protein
MGLLSGFLGGSKQSYGLAPESDMQRWAKPLYQQLYGQYDPSQYTDPLQQIGQQLMGYNPMLNALSGQMAGVGGDITGLMPTALGYGGQAAGYGGLGAGYGGLAAGYGGLGANYGGQAAGYGALGAGYGDIGAGYGQAGAQVGQQAQQTAGQTAGGMTGLAGGISGLAPGALQLGASSAPMMQGAMQQFLDPTGTNLYRDAMSSYMGDAMNRFGQQMAQTSATGSGLGARGSSGDITTRGNIADMEARRAADYSSNLALGLSQQGGQLFPQFANTGFQGLGQAGQLMGAGLQGLGQAGQLQQQGYGTQLAGLGLGQQGSALGMQGAQTGISGALGGMQGAQTGIQGAQTGISGAQTGIAGAQGGLSGTSTAGNLGATGVNAMGQSLAPTQLALSNLLSQPELLGMMFGMQYQQPMQWLQQAYGMTPGVVQTGQRQWGLGGQLPFSLAGMLSNPTVDPRNYSGIPGGGFT